MLLAFRWARRLVVAAGAGRARSSWAARRPASGGSRGRTTARRSDAIIVLGAAQFDGRPSSVFKARLQHARELFEEGVAPRVITVGGGAPGDRTTEAEAGAAFLRERDVEAVAVPEGRNTLQSARGASSELMAEQGWDTAVLVTDPWHSLRSRTMARDLGHRRADLARPGPARRCAPAAPRCATSPARRWRYLYYKALGRSGESGPQRRLTAQDTARCSPARYSTASSRSPVAVAQSASAADSPTASARARASRSASTGPYAASSAARARPSKAA